MAAKSHRIHIFSSARGMFTKTDHTLGHNASLNKFKRNQAIKSVFSHQKRIKLKISYKMISWKKDPKYLETKYSISR